MENKKLFYPIGEVSEMFDLPTSTIRFWEQEFDILKPKKNKKGNRLFTNDDIENLKIIYHLLKEQGFTLAGAKAQLKEMKKGNATADPIKKQLEHIKSQLEQLKNEL